ncbi:hypothetical protein [Castellaniella sp.]|uniref:hypothetical protein n=1 Tax=Castellaniella sp. TaxID=1955812 RepID=UPI003C740E9F
MNRIVWLLAAAALSCGAGLSAARAQQAAGEGSGLIDLSPQRYAVPDVSLDAPQPLGPVDPLPIESPADGADILYQPIPYDALFLHPYGADASGMGGWGMPDDATMPLTARDLFAPPASRGLDTWSLGERRWRYLSSSGYGVTLGSLDARLPAWGQTVPLAGVGVYRLRPSGTLPAGAWDYAVAAGALDARNARPSAEGDLSYGSVAVDASVKYALDRQATLVSRLQQAQGLSVLGVGGAYSAGIGGTWRVGVSDARQPQDRGLRRQLGYTLGLRPGLDLSWVNVRQGAGYADLASYGLDTACACIRNQWQLDLAAGRWGSFSGSFERREYLDGSLDQPPEQQFGLTHGFRYGPYLRVRLETTRNLTSGDYGWGARFSLPLP